MVDCGSLCVTILVSGEFVVAASRALYRHIYLHFLCEYSQVSLSPLSYSTIVSFALSLSFSFLYISIQLCLSLYFSKYILSYSISIFLSISPFRSIYLSSFLYLSPSISLSLSISLFLAFYLFFFRNVNLSSYYIYFPFFRSVYFSNFSPMLFPFPSVFLLSLHFSPSRGFVLVSR